MFLINRYINIILTFLIRKFYMFILDTKVDNLFSNFDFKHYKLNNSLNNFKGTIIFLNIYGYSGFRRVLDKFGTKSDLYSILIYDSKAIKQNKLN